MKKNKRSASRKKMDRKKLKKSGQNGETRMIDLKEINVELTQSLERSKTVLQDLRTLIGRI
jgi:hypothetical protein